MGRCEGYYRVENRRCDRDASTLVRGGDGATYGVCAYHGRDVSQTQVARWQGESGIRRGGPTGLALEPRLTASAA